MAKKQTYVLDAEQLQREHYDAIGKAYDAHYSDFWSLQYRLRFICEPMFAGVHLSGKKVLDAMCGSGQLTQYLLAHGASVTGLDISPNEMASYREKWHDAQAVCASALDTGLADNSFDCVAVVGGLHHLHPGISQAISEFYRVLKPGGHLCFAEPHTGSLPDLVRERWYKHDPLFSHNESAINFKALKDEFAPAFAFKSELYLGSVAYLFVLNSMVFRLPVAYKSFYAPTMIRLESIIGKLQGRLLSCFVVAQWQKK